MAELRVEVLSREHRSLLRGFRNQQPSIEEFLGRFALRHSERDLLSRTYVALDMGEADTAAFIGGYFSLTVTTLHVDEARKVPTLERLPRYPVPGVLLARLGVDNA